MNKQKHPAKFFNKAEILILILVASAVLSACGKSEDTIRAYPEETEEATEESDAAAETGIAAGLYIVIDPGHGFDDVGTQSGYTQEDEYYYTLLYSEEIAEKLESYGATAVLTHDGETYPDEDELTRLVAEYGITFSSENVKATAGDNLFNKYERVMYTSVLNYENGVDFFLSVHFNSYDTDETYGTAVFYYEDNPEAELCDTFADYVMEKTGYPTNYNGIYSMDYEDAYAVIKYGDYAGALIECAFMTNASDAANIESETWRDQMTDYIVYSMIYALTGVDLAEE